LLSTDRLVFRPFAPGDLPLLADLHGDPDVMRHLSVDGRAWSGDVLAAKLERFIEEQARHGFSKWKVHRRDDDRFVGRAGFSPFEGDVELGFILKRELWGAGYATECARGLLAWMDRNCPQIGRVVAFAHPENLASCRVLEKVGMTPIGRRILHGADHAFYEWRRSA
jgi:ribosomal-protein-alanine N-acetyltransferase